MKTAFLNAAAVKKYALAFAKRTKAQPFTQVAEEFVQDIDSEVRLLIQRRVARHPSCGKTLRRV